MGVWSAEEQLGHKISGSSAYSHREEQSWLENECGEREGLGQS